MSVDDHLSNWVGCSRWTSAGRNHAVHIAEADGGPICKKLYRGGTLRREPFNISAVTCKRCKMIFKKEGEK